MADEWTAVLTFSRCGKVELAWADGGEPDEVPGVYSITSERPFRRLRGTTSTLYIGQTTNLRQRMRTLGSEAHDVALRLYLAEVAPVKIHAVPRADPALDEALSLHKFEQAHGELPPLNRSGTTHLVSMVLKRIATRLAQRLRQLQGLGERNVRRMKAVDSFTEGWTAVDIFAQGKPRVRVIWFWPAAYGGDTPPAWWPLPKDRCLDHAYVMLDRDWTMPNVSNLATSRLWAVAVDRRERRWLVHRTWLYLPLKGLENLNDDQMACLAEAEPLDHLSRDALIGDVFRHPWAWASGCFKTAEAPK